MRKLVAVSLVALASCSGKPATAATAELAAFYRVRAAMPFPAHAVEALGDRLPAAPSRDVLSGPRLDALLALPGRLSRGAGPADRAALADAARAAGFASVEEAAATERAAHVAWDVLVELQAIERESPTVSTAATQERLAALGETYLLRALSRPELEAVYARREALQPVLDALAGAQLAVAAR